MIEQASDWTGQVAASVPLDWGTMTQIALVVFLTAVADLVVRQVFKRMERKALASDRVWDDAFAISFRRPVRFGVWVIGLSAAISLIGKDVQADIFGVVPQVRMVALIVLATWAFIRVVRRVEENLVSRWREKGESVDQTTVDAVSKLVRITIMVTASLIILQTLGFSLTSLLAAGGIGGLAIGFAAQDLLANFFGGLTIYMERPFSVGDWVRSPDREIEGTVEQIGWRRTAIRTFDLRPLYVPNAVFNKIALENPSRMFHRRIYETVGVRYDDFGVVEPILEDIRKYLHENDEITKNRTLMVYFNAFGASSLDFFIYCFTETRVWTEYHAVKEQVLLEVGRIIESHGAEIAFPTRTLHVPEGVSVNAEPTAVPADAGGGGRE